MELYLRWLDKYEKCDGEGSPLGLILCAEKTTEHVELLQPFEALLSCFEKRLYLPCPESSFCGK
jgi:hypothetical protein